MPLEAPYDPVELNKVQEAFPADALDYMPEWDVVADARDRLTWQLDFQRDWMFRGVESDIMFIPRDSSWGQAEVDRAFRHLGAIQNSYAPKHEHKEAAVAFLIDTWFEYGRWRPRGESEFKGSWPEELDDATPEEAERARAEAES